jgi:hypothetical protein
MFAAATYCSQVPLLVTMVSFSHAFALLAKPVQVKHFSELLQEARTNMEAMPPKMKNFFIKGILVYQK